MNKIKYCSLKYYNSIISSECLCIGVLFHNLTTGEVTFNHIKNFRRLHSFDDEININFIKLYLASIKEEVESSIFNYNVDFDLEKYVKTYANEFRFSEINFSENQDEAFTDNMTKLYLKFDYDKKERLEKTTEIRYIRNALKSASVDFTSKPVIGTRKENIGFDFQTSEYAIKIFSFEDKNLNRLIPSAKLWAYNAMDIRPYKKTIFLYDAEIVDSSEFEAVMSILREYAYKLVPISDGVSWMSSIA